MQYYFHRRDICLNYHEMDAHIDLDTEDDDAMERLVSFYVHNGYQVEEENELNVLRRGKSGAGWWSSNMSELQTEVHARKFVDKIELRYEVEVKGQRLTKMDQAFWKREAREAERYVLGEEDELLDLRPREAERAAKVKERLRGRGKWTAAGIFLIIFILGIITERFGCNPFI